MTNAWRKQLIQSCSYFYFCFCLSECVYWPTTWCIKLLLFVTPVQECVSAGAGLSIVGSGSGTSVGGEMPGSFVPTVTAITTSQDLQWMVQPTLISSQASGQSGSTGTTTMTQPVSLVDPYDMPGPSYSSGSGFTPPTSDTPGPAPGPIRQSRTRSRRTRDESVSEDGDVGVLVSVCA